MSRQRLLGFIGLAISLTVGSTAFAANPYLHYFDCKNCHFPNATMAQMSANHICLKCHSGAIATAPSDKLFAAPASARIDGTSAGVFSTGDASGRFGHNPSPVQQSSHNWAALNTQPAAGAQEPNRALYTGFYSRYGASLGKVTCSRCHNPHGEAVLDANNDNLADNPLANPKLLIADAANSYKPMEPEKMCRACHEVWANTNDHGWLTHPLIADYAAVAGAKPGYKPAQSIVDAAAAAAAGGRSAVNLISYQGATGIGCLSCHAVHYADSDAGTADGVGHSLSDGDGKLLRGDGAGRADTSGLCQSCHTYQSHGSSEQVGCLVCHGGHSYDPARPNYFVLRKSATTTAYGTVSGLDYSAPEVLDAGLKYTFWNDRTDGTANGYCERCHGDARIIPDGGGGYHTTTAVCTDCHRHGGTAGTFAPGCNLCHGMPPTASAPGVPDGLVVTPAPTNSTTAGAHTTHVTTKQYACDSCHYNSAGRGTTHNDGAPQSITIGFSLFNNAYRGGTYNGQGGVNYDSSQADTTVTTTGTKTCANVYCHGSSMAANGGTNLNPTWDNPITGSCGKCHGATAATPPLRGSHRTHVMNDTWYYDTRSNPPNPYIYGQKLACATCHNTNAATHVNGQADWAFNTSGDTRLTGATYKGSSGGATATVPGVYGQCANLYCHSIAQTSTGGPLTGLPGEYQNPTWGALSEGTCGSCHNADQGHAWFANRGSYGNWAPYITSGSHARHLQSLAGPDPVGMSECAVCHNYVGSDSLSSCASLCHNRNDLHVNHQVDVKFPPTLYGTTVVYSGTPEPGDGYGNCANTYCHGKYPGSGKNATPMWGEVSSAACGSCHGASNSDLPASGSHNMHAGSFKIACPACHSGVIAGSSPGPYTVADQVKHANGKVDWAFNAADSRLQGGSERYNIASGASPPSDGTTPRAYSTCENIYCHSNVQPNGGVGKPDSYATPAWGSTGLTCNSCHKGGVHRAAGPLIDSGSHTAHLAYPFAADDLSKCSICHSYVPDTANPGCISCHDIRNPNGSLGDVLSRHVDGNVMVEFATKFGSSSSYTGTPKPSDGYGNCTNTYCHGNYPGSGKNATPKWGDASTAACGSCHGAANTNSAAPVSGNHVTHAGNYKVPCTSCHSGIVSGSGPYTIANLQKHADGKVDWAFDATDIRFQGGAERYNIATGTAPPSDGTTPRTYSTCENLYCHSTVQSGSDGTGPPVYGKPTWGANTGCDGCHAGSEHKTNAHGADGSTALVTGSHQAHLEYRFDTAGSYQVRCNTCHAWDARPGLLGCERCHSPAGNDQIFAKHANGRIDIVFSPDFTGSGSYNGSGVPQSGFNNCSNTYCHSNGTSIASGTIPANTSPRWGSGNMTCAGCHGFPPAYSNGSPKANSHGRHNYGCNTCHYTTTSNGTTITATSSWGTPNHVSKSYTVAPGTGVTFTYSYNASGGTCSNISCHSNSNAQWGTELGCNGCHGNPPATGAHLAHADGTGAAYGSDSNTSTPGAYSFNCGNCHPLAGSKHADGAVDVELYNAAATGFKQNNPASAGRTGTGTATVCRNIYCHSSGQDVSVRSYVDTPRWDGSLSGNRCAGCHGDPPVYGSGGAGAVNANSHFGYSWEDGMPVEGGHLIGLHFDNIKVDPLDPNGGLIPFGGPPGSGAAHGDPATSTTISCPTCHAATVTVAGQRSAQGTVFACENCHTTPVAGTIADRAKHVNGSRDVVFMTGDFRTRAQLKPDWIAPPRPGPFTAVIAPLGWTRNNGFKTASNSYDSIPFSGSYNAADKSCTTACHLNQPVRWGESNFDCFSCHADL